MSLGRKGGVRPGDLVGAIANESGLTGREIGPIRIADNYSVVGVPEGSVDMVVAAMRSATMRGKPVRQHPRIPQWQAIVVPHDPTVPLQTSTALSPRTGGCWRLCKWWR